MLSFPSTPQCSGVAVFITLNQHPLSTYHTDYRLHCQEVSIYKMCIVICSDLFVKSAASVSPLDSGNLPMAVMVSVYIHSFFSLDNTSMF